MSTVHVWFDETEIDWGPRREPVPDEAPPPRPRRRAGRWAALAGVLAVAVAGGLAFVDLGGDPGAGTAPPLRAFAQPAAGPAPAVVTLETIAQCESRGDPTAVSADGVYRGKYQFDMATWQSVGGTGDPALAPEREQDRRARMLAADRGAAPWPACGTAARTG